MGKYIQINILTITNYNMLSHLIPSHLQIFLLLCIAFKCYKMLKCFNSVKHLSKLLHNHWPNLSEPEFWNITCYKYVFVGDVIIFHGCDLLLCWLCQVRQFILALSSVLNYTGRLN